jgi:hypothetical protein
MVTFNSQLADSESPTIRGVGPSDIDFTISVTEFLPAPDAEPTGQTTVDDALLDTFDQAEVSKSYELEVVPTAGNAPFEVEFRSLDESKAVVDSFGHVSLVGSGGAVGILTTLRNRHACTKRTNLTLTSENVGSPTRFVEFVEGSLGREMSEAVDSRIAGKNPSTTKAVYASQNHDTATYVRNPNLWCADIDLTCCSPWNSYDGAKRAGVLISPRHIAMAHHYYVPNGATMRFVAADGTVVSRTVTNSVRVGSDIRIGVLNSDVPETISFAKVLPANFLDYLPGIGYGVPVLALDQEEKALVQQWHFASNGWTGLEEPTTADRLAFHETIISGDSGGQLFAIGNGQVALLTCFYTALGGESYASNISQINSQMTSLGGGYQLTEMDITDFTDFS